MQTRPPQMPPPARVHTGGPVVPFRHNHAPGEITPEVSPLGQLIYRGRMLKKELQHTTEHDVPPRPSPSEPHSGRPAHHTPIDEAQGFHLRNDHAVSRRTEVPPSPRPVPVEMRMPRFSTITNDSYGDRESMYSNDRDSTIMGAFSVGAHTAGPPGIQSAPKAVRQEFNEGRDSVRPTIGHSHLEEELQQAPQPQTAKAESNPVRESVKPVLASVDDLDDDEEEISPTGTGNNFPAEWLDGRMREGGGVGRPGGGPSAMPGGSAGMGGPGFVSGGRPGPPNMMPGGDRRGSPGPSGHPALNRAHAQPGLRNQRPPPNRQPSGDDYRQPPSAQAAPYAPRQYQPYRQEASNPSGYGPPPRQGSAENGRFPPPFRTSSAENGRFLPPLRTGSGNSDRLIPVRTDSRGSDTHFGPFAPPSRQDSNESEKARYAPYRQGSASSLPVRQNSLESGGDRDYPRNSPSPQPPSILPMITDERAATPDSHMTIQPGILSPLYSPNPWEMERSASAASDVNSTYTIGGTRKPAFNFSRPLGSGRPSMDSQHWPSIDTLNMSHDHDPLLHGEQIDNVQEGPAPTYVYTKFDLPRGRLVGRDSVVFQDSHNVEGQQQQSQQQPQQQQPQQQQNRGARPQGPHPGPSMSPSSPKSSMLSPPPRLLPVPAPGSPRFDNRGPSSTTPTAPPPKSPRLPPSPSAVLTPDEHLSKGIDLHEKGFLQESTYHLRCAAHGGHPTGMLLYALACRHGWGMRPNQREGVQWLKKVTQLASSEVADDEIGVVNVPFIEKQGRRAQFALSIYELGVSHLNGWGTEMDKGLALNCFEIAGKWGDPDALSEAGFCWANGVGCKKDLKKAAKFYRMAEGKGVSMVGNSWIWKDKYLDDEDRALKLKKEGGGAKKEKEGGLFSKKKSPPT